MLLPPWIGQHTIFQQLITLRESLELLLKFTSEFTSSEDTVNHEKESLNKK